MLKKFILILALLVSFAEAKDIIKLKSIDEIKEGKHTIVMFSMNFCPWCMRQRSVLEEHITPLYPDIDVFEAKLGTDIYDELVSTTGIEIKYHPTTALMKKEDGELVIIFEFYGYQEYSYITDVLEDKDIMDL